MVETLPWISASIRGFGAATTILSFGLRTWLSALRESRIRLRYAKAASEDDRKRTFADFWLVRPAQTGSKHTRLICEMSLHP
jgi:hypothetical protein